MPVSKHRHGQHHVIEVGNCAAVVWVVADKHVAVFDFIGVVVLEDLLHGLVEHTDKGRDSGA